MKTHENNTNKKNRTKQNEAKITKYKKKIQQNSRDFSLN